MNYWMDPDERNTVLRYMGNVNAGKRSQYLVGLFREFVSPDQSILEIGCNVGRNLAYLWNAGYHKLSGIELNPKAVEIARLAFSGQDVDIVLDNFGPSTSGEYDVVYTMAVLEHIPDDEAVKNVAAIAQKTIICIEDEVSDSPLHFPRNYREFFEALGWNQIYISDGIPGVNGRFKGRIFVK